jgi:hypothetical protein
MQSTILLVFSFINRAGVAFANSVIFVIRIMINFFLYKPVFVSEQFVEVAGDGLIRPAVSVVIACHC